MPLSPEPAAMSQRLPDPASRARLGGVQFVMLGAYGDIYDMEGVAVRLLDPHDGAVEIGDLRVQPPELRRLAAFLTGVAQGLESVGATQRAVAECSTTTTQESEA